jgi:hypothetical protein
MFTVAPSTTVHITEKLGKTDEVGGNIRCANVMLLCALDGHCGQLGPAVGQTKSGILRLDVAGGIMGGMSGLTR